MWKLSEWKLSYYTACVNKKIDSPLAFPSLHLITLFRWHLKSIKSYTIIMYFEEEKYSEGVSSWEEFSVEWKFPRWSTSKLWSSHWNFFTCGDFFFYKQSSVGHFPLRETTQNWLENSCNRLKCQIILRLLLDSNKPFATTSVEWQFNAQPWSLVFHWLSGTWRFSQGFSIFLKLVRAD